MSWTTIEDSDLEDAKIAALVTALRTAALGSTQTDPFENVRTNVILQIRAEIASSQKWQLDSDENKVPRDLKSLACRMVYRELATRLQEPLTEDEQKERDYDNETLKAIREGKRAVASTDSPLEAPEVQVGSGVQVVSSTTVLTTREKMSGL
ncbi:MAG TPA: hypothetical protein VF773_10865 [Verrucomicrobiae bacterium]